MHPPVLTGRQGRPPTLRAMLSNTTRKGAPVAPGAAAATPAPTMVTECPSHCRYAGNAGAAPPPWASGCGGTGPGAPGPRRRSVRSGRRLPPLETSDRMAAKSAVWSSAGPFRRVGSAEGPPSASGAGYAPSLGKPGTGRDGAPPAAATAEAAVSLAAPAMTAPKAASCPRKPGRASSVSRPASGTKVSCVASSPSVHATAASWPPPSHRPSMGTGASLLQPPPSRARSEAAAERDAGAEQSRTSAAPSASSPLAHAHRTERKYHFQWAGPIDLLEPACPSSAGMALSTEPAPAAAAAASTAHAERAPQLQPSPWPRVAEQPHSHTSNRCAHGTADSMAAGRPGPNAAAIAGDRLAKPCMTALCPSSSTQRPTLGDVTAPCVGRVAPRRRRAASAVGAAAAQPASPARPASITPACASDSTGRSGAASAAGAFSDLAGSLPPSAVRVRPKQGAPRQRENFNSSPQRPVPYCPGFAPPPG
mmetsp:Transcript_18467/g.69982  ORF Transcript_18467/g.69982 Transcript_18467/m.69982 type:complete len:479 (-) Transcript_18467:42-1478(-)